MRRNVSELARDRRSARPAAPFAQQRTARSPRPRVFPSDSEALTRVNDEISLDQLRLQFLANMNHELRTPLHGLMGATELLALTKLDAEQRHYLDIFRSSSQQLLGLVDNILDFSKMLSGELRLHRSHFDLKQVVKDCYDHFLPFAERKGIALVFDISEKCPRWVYADAKRVSQILYHLVANALKFTFHGSVEIRVGCDKARAVMSVKDSGVGITPEIGDRVFEAFYQEDSSHTRKHGGAGMGLAISRFLANAMDGQITLDSEVGRGSEFTLKFPYLIPEDERMDPGAVDSPQPRILLVEDNEINQAIVYLLFSKRGLHIDIAQDGLEGLNSHKKNHYDLIFMDMQMPVMDGIEATRLIREFDSDVQIIALTANLVPEDKDKAIKAGMNDFLCKPLDLTSLEKVLDHARNRLRN